MLPVAPLMKTAEMALDGTPTAIPVPAGMQVWEVRAIGTAEWTYQPDADSDAFPVPADTEEQIPLALRDTPPVNEILVAGSGTLSLTFYGDVLPQQTPQPGVNTLTVPRITSGATITGTEAEAITPYESTATGLPAPTFSLEGTLPDGLTFDAETGEISGTPTSDGETEVTLVATNEVGEDRKVLTITIAETPP